MLRRLAGAARSPPAALRRLLRLLHTAGGSVPKAESVAYRMSMHRPPSVVRRWGLAENSCSLIGRIDAQVTPFDRSSDESPRAYTFLKVSPPSSSSKFSVTLDFKGNLAKISLKHLKHNDLVYVSGFLKSYHKVIPSGERYIIYKIHVQELNYVIDQNKKPQCEEDSVSSMPSADSQMLKENKHIQRHRLPQCEEGSASSMPSADPQMLKENKYIQRLRLWQIFFANPDEWWDNRQSKKHFSWPDFKHKDTHEKIWIHRDDPPWVRKQLKLHDLEMSEKGQKCKGRSLENHNWKAQDFYYSDR